MNNRNTRILKLLSFAVLLFAGTAQAQLVQHVVRVKVPFDFTVDEKNFPAGDYSVVCAPGHLELRDSQAHVMASLITHSVESPSALGSPKLEFSTDIGGHALRRVWLENNRIGYELAPSKASLLLARQRSHGTVQASGGGNRP